MASRTSTLVVAHAQVRARVADLQRTLDQTIMELRQYGANWTRLLDKLAVVNVQYMQVCTVMIVSIAVVSRLFSSCAYADHVAMPTICHCKLCGVADHGTAKEHPEVVYSVPSTSRQPTNSSR